MAEAPDADESWHLVPVPLPAPGRSVAFDAGGRRVLLCNVDGAPYALEDRCPHVRVPLSGGRLEGPVLECPLHGGRLDVRDGQPVARPIRKAAVVFPVRAAGDGLEVRLDAPSR